MNHNYIDQNTKNVGFGMIQGTKQVLPITVVPNTNELRIEIIPSSTAGSIIPTRNINLDENTHQITAAVTDDSQQEIIPLTVVEVVNVPCLRIEL